MEAGSFVAAYIGDNRFDPAVGKLFLVLAYHQPFFKLPYC
jgi:hypothetical protein